MEIAASARDDGGEPLPRDLEPDVLDTIRAVEHATMTSAERLAALVQAVKWIDRRGLPGSVVECGVWRGGSMMAAALTLLRLGDQTRDLYLYDTFAGMTQPQEIDRAYDGGTAEQAMAAHDPSAKSMSDWCNASLEEVRRNMASTAYPSERIHYVAGPVEATIPGTLPGPIALLRLDTDFYASTRQELEHLYPLVVPGGVVIIDDYGAWQGARRAVDEFLLEKPEIYLHRIDVTGRLFIKQPPLSTTISPDAALPSGAIVGRHTYGHDASTFQIFIPEARIEVGAFCSIAPEVRILAGSEHITTRATTFPLKAALFDQADGNAGDVLDKGTTVIGNDVWLGLGATVLSGVLVGDGAVIGAGAVVSKSVPPYAIVTGNPAQVIRYRFEPQIRRRLLALGWWDWDDEDIRALKSLFVADVESFLDEAERGHGPVAESELNRRLRETPGELMTPHRIGAADARAPSPATAQRVGELEAQIAGMRSTAAWRWATRYWRFRSRLRLG